MSKPQVIVIFLLQIQSETLPQLPDFHSLKSVI